MGSPPRRAVSGGHDSCQATRTAATCTLSRGGARCHGAALSASKFRRGAARQSAATSMAGFLVNCSSTKRDIRTWYVYQNFTFRTELHPYSSTSMEWVLRRVVLSAAVTTHAKLHAQQQLARDLKMERPAVGQRCRPQRFGEVQRGNPQPRRWLDFLLTAANLNMVWVSIQYYCENFLTNVRGPPDNYGLLTLGRPCARCYSTLRGWSPVCGSRLRVSHDKITTKGDIYVSGTYTKFAFSFSV